MKQPNQERIFIQEVVSRDGFQNENTFIDTDDKVALIDHLSSCGYAKIEVTSFTSPKAIPALRDAEEVMRRIKRTPDVIYTALIPNLRGAERALSCDVDELNLVMSVSESHNRANLRMSCEDSFAKLSEVIRFSRDHYASVNVSLSTTFGCPMEGDVAEDAVYHLLDRFSDLGVARFTLCDTTGMAYPTQVNHIAEKAKTLHPEAEFALHFHNTRGMALANVIAALDAGINRFDSSLGGLGGCPYAPGATGNVCTEDLVHMLDLMNYDTGVDLHVILQASQTLPVLVGHDVPSQILKAGRRTRRYAVPAEQ